ncbi:MAG: site-specific DNA-methyltransferase [Methanobrevibacter sp.]|nr:site-specific DNA-methyltransferase [Candidatus Methanoflexus mossambicus]
MEKSKSINNMGYTTQTKLVNNPMGDKVFQKENYQKENYQRENYQKENYQKVISQIENFENPQNLPINQILKGDSIEELKKIPDKSINLIFADPPYFMQTDGVLKRTDGSNFSGVEDKWDKFENYEEYDNFCESWLKECKRILTDDGTIWVIGSFQNIYRLGYIMQNLEFWILNDVIWSKPNAVPNFSGSRFQNSHETMIWCSKSKKSRFTFNYKTMKKLNNNKQDKSVWDIGICIGNERLKDENGKKIHSTQKPEKLLEKVILSSSKINDVVLDPFFGTGTTGAIAKRYGRNFIGIEREEKYIDFAKIRIENETLEINEFVTGELEIKPPKVEMKKLIEDNFLNVGDKVFNKKKEYIGTITEKGYVFDGEDELSIHKSSAKKLGKQNNNGWNYFYLDDGTLINELRDKWSEKQ